MKAGIWGAGKIAATHAEALKAEGIAIGAVVDTNGSQAEEFAKAWNAERWGDDASLLFRDDIAAVHVCTPPNLHYEMVSSLLQAGKHVLCEKPLCFDDGQALELALLAGEKQLVCAVNLNVRFHMACQKAREIVAAPDFGRVMLVHGHYMQEFHALPAPFGWRYNPALAGRMRAVTEIGTHWMDLAQYISGRKITAVSALFGNFHPDRMLDGGMMYPADTHGAGELVTVASEDAATLNIRFENGAIGCALFSEVSPGRVNSIALEVTGAGRNLWWNSEDNNRLRTAWKGEGYNTRVFGFGNGFVDTFRALQRAFYADVRVGKKSDGAPYPNFDEGARMVRLCNAVLKSADEGFAWIPVE